MLKKQNLLLFLCSLIFCFYAFEAYLYLSRMGVYSEHSLNRSIRMNAAISQGIDFDTRTKLEFLKDSQLSGWDHVLRISPIGFTSLNGLNVNDEQVYPLSGVSSRPTVFCNVHGDYLVYQSDEWGFRNPGNKRFNKALEIAVVGDSFAMGHCEERDIGSLLRQRDFSVANFSYTGNGPLLELASLREYASYFKPHVVLWLYFEGNDLSDLKKERQSPILMNYLNENYRQGLIGRQAALDQRLLQYSQAQQVKQEAQVKKRYHWRQPLVLSGVVALLKKNVKQVFPSRSANNSVEFALFQQVLSQAKRDVESWGGELYFIYLPEWRRMAGVRLSETAKQRDSVLVSMEKLDIPVIDLTNDMLLDENPVTYFPFNVNGHYNAKGYSLLAERITQRLDQKVVELEVHK